MSDRAKLARYLRVCTEEAEAIRAQAARLEIHLQALTGKIEPNTEPRKEADNAK